MKLVTLILLLLFIVFRNSFTLIQGKRDRKKVTLFIYWGRKFIEIFICFVFPVLLLLEIFETNISSTLYYFGVILSVVGILLMVWTRITRNKDWGFMGDDSGDTLFIHGPYKIIRHPYYTGSILTGVGIYLQLNYVFVALMIPVIIFIVYVTKQEDIFLEKKFGEEFIQYKKNVKALFPFVY